LSEILGASTHVSFKNAKWAVMTSAYDDISSRKHYLNKLVRWLMYPNRNSSYQTGNKWSYAQDEDDKKEQDTAIV
jgi:hypothetical protein